MSLKSHIFLAKTSVEMKWFIDFGFCMMQKTRYGGLQNRETELELFDPQKNHILKRGGHVIPLLFKDNEGVKGRIAVFLDPEIQPIACIGLFDCIDDIKVSSCLFEAAAALIKEHSYSQVVGPMNGSIFDSYRIMTEGFEQRPFLGEPRNPDYYEHLFLRCGFKRINTWETVELTAPLHTNPFSSHRKNHENFLKLGYSVQQFKNFEELEMIKLTYQLISKSYQVFPYYSSISEADFIEHSKHMPTLIDQDCSLFLFNPEKQMVGVIIILRDLFFTVQAYKGASWLKKLGYFFDSKEGKTLNMLQGASLPQYIREAYIEGMRAFNTPVSLTTAALYQSFEYALQRKKYDQAMITLMREGAEINQYFKKISKPTRKYCLFELDV